MPQKPQPCHQLPTWCGMQTRRRRFIRMPISCIIRRINVFPESSCASSSHWREVTNPLTNCNLVKTRHVAAQEMRENAHHDPERRSWGRRGEASRKQSREEEMGRSESNQAAQGVGSHGKSGTSTCSIKKVTSGAPPRRSGEEPPTTKLVTARPRRTMDRKQQAKRRLIDAPSLI
jgi:hypothetical protein